MNWILPSVVVIALAGLTTIAASERLRTRYLGNKPLLNAGLPLVAAGLVWLATQGGGLARSILVEGSVPPAVLDVFIEDIQFGLPTVSDLYKERRLNSEDLNAIFTPFRDLTETVSLTAEEAAQLNALAAQSGMVQPVNPGRVYSMREVAGLLRSLSYYYEYTQWAPLARQWSARLEDGASGAGTEVWQFVQESLETDVESAGVLSGIVGMMALEMIEVDSSTQACLPEPFDGIVLEEIQRDEGSFLALSTPRYTLPLVGLPSNQRRIEKAGRLVELFRFGCSTQLAMLFERASRVFEREANLIEQAVTTWNRALADRRSSRIAATVTISNLGKYNAFIRRDASIIVGPRGEESPERQIRLILRAHLDDADSPYIRIPSRDVTTLQFAARMNDEDKERIYHSFASGLTYLRMAVLANSGAHTSVSYSDLVPFSAEAKTAAETDLVERIKLRL